MLALAHPSLLWTGLALATVPILIHLFFRRRFRVVRWAAMEFLLAALRKQKRRVEVENLILLLMRIAMIALLGLAIARPAVEAASFNPMGESARAVVLVLDNSASMQAVLNGRPMLERARENASKVLLDLPEDSRVTLIASRGGGGAPQIVLENATPEEARARLGGIGASFGRNRIAEIFRLAGRKLGSMRGRPMVVFLSDLQSRDWLPGGARSDDIYSSLRQLTNEEGQSPPIVLLDISGGQNQNIVVTDLQIDEGREAFAPSIVGISATLVNFGTAPAGGRVALFVGRPDGGWERKQSEPVAEIAPTLVTAQPEEFIRKTVQFHLPLRKEDEGPLPLKVVFEPEGSEDRLEIDNSRYLAVRARPPVRFLPVRSYDRALEVLRDMESVEIIEFDQAIYPNNLADEKLDSIDVIIWADANIHDLDREGAERLETFVRNGGGLLVYLGQEARPEKVNAMFFKEQREGVYPGLLPFLLADGNMELDDASEIRFDLGSTKGPLFAEMSETPELFYSPRILGFRGVSKDKTADLDSYVRARYTNGEPAVLVHRLGAGRVVAVTTTPDERAIALDGSILPAAMFFNAAHFLVEQDPSLRNVSVGETITIPLLESAREVVIEPPDRGGGRATEPVTEPGKPFKLSRTSSPGLYRITVRGVEADSTTPLPTEVRHIASVNLDPMESDLRRAPNLAKVYGVGGIKLMFSSEVEEALPAAVADGDEIARTLLGLVVLLLIAELVLAWYFGNRRRRLAAA